LSRDCLPLPNANLPKELKGNTLIFFFRACRVAAFIDRRQILRVLANRRVLRLPLHVLVLFLPFLVGEPTILADPIVSLSDVLVQPGDQFRVSILVTPVYDLAGADFSISYNADSFILLPPFVQAASATNGFSLVSNPQDGWIQISMASPTGLHSYSGPLAEISFQCLNQATPGRSNIYLNLATLYSSAAERIPCSTRDGSVTIEDFHTEPEKPEEVDPIPVDSGGARQGEFNRQPAAAAVLPNPNSAISESYEDSSVRTQRQIVQEGSNENNLIEQDENNAFLTSNPAPILAQENERTNPHLPNSDHHNVANANPGNYLAENLPEAGTPESDIGKSPNIISSSSESGDNVKGKRFYWKILLCSLLGATIVLFTAKKRKRLKLR